MMSHTDVTPLKITNAINEIESIRKTIPIKEILERKNAGYKTRKKSAKTRTEIENRITF